MRKRRFTRKRKLGANFRDLASRRRIANNNYKQTRDIHEDRGTLQSRLGALQPTAKRNPRPRP
jgi:hypothetical protein